jgi:aryl-alcohol dehydrogenase-like predicted oxidoreductase
MILKKMIFDEFNHDFPKNLQLVDELTGLTKKKGYTPGQLTSAWIHAQGADFIGTTKIKYLEENVAAPQIKLTKLEIEEIRQTCEEAGVQGERYPPGMSANLFADSAPKKT